MTSTFSLAWMFHESLAATTDMAVLPGVLGRRSLRRTLQVRLGTHTLRVPGGTSILFALAALRSVPQAGSQFRGLATAIHKISRLGTFLKPLELGKARSQSIHLLTDVSCCQSIALRPQPFPCCVSVVCCSATPLRENEVGTSSVRSFRPYPGLGSCAR
jgi:hypothetical protein